MQTLHKHMLLIAILVIGLLTAFPAQPPAAQSPDLQYDLLIVGNHLYYGRGDEPVTLDTHSLFYLDTTSWAVTRLDVEWRPLMDLSPDGRLLPVAYHGQLCLMNARQEFELCIPADDVLLCDESRAGCDISYSHDFLWDPDGQTFWARSAEGPLVQRRIADGIIITDNEFPPTTYNVYAHIPTIPTRNIGHYEEETAILEMLCAIDTPDNTGGDNHFGSYVESHNGQLLAYRCRTQFEMPNRPRAGLWVYNVATNEKRLLVMELDMGAAYLSWSPDDAAIAQQLHSGWGGCPPSGISVVLLDSEYHRITLPFATGYDSYATGQILTWIPRDWLQTP